LVFAKIKINTLVVFDIVVKVPFSVVK